MATKLLSLLLLATFAAPAPGQSTHNQSRQSHPASTAATRQVWAGADTNTLGTPAPDGSFLSFVDTSTGDLAIRNLKTGEKRRLTHNSQETKGQFAYFSVISPDSRRIAYAWFNDQKFYDLRIATLDGSEPKTIYRNTEAGFVQPCAFSPDGKQILTLLFRKDNISQIALISTEDGSAKILRSLNWVYPKKMDFSPDGRFIVYDVTIRDDEPERDIFVLAADGSSQTKLVDHPADDLFPLWTPDGGHVVFASDRSGTIDVWRIPVADGKAQGPARRIKKDLGRFLPMAFTRQGLLYYALKTGASDIYVLDFHLAGGEIYGQPKIAPSRFAGGNLSPDWSPGGRYLAYLSHFGTENYGQEYRAISIRDVETGEERTITPRLAYIERVRWSPDGQSLLASGVDGRDRRGLFRVGLDGEDAEIVAEQPEASFRGLEGAWSADGKTVFYIREEAGQSVLKSREIESGEEKELYRSPKPARFRLLAASPDGSMLAFVAREDTKKLAEAIFLSQADGGKTRRILRAARGGLLDIEWAPKGDHLLVSTAGSPAPGLWRVSLHGDTPVQLSLKLKRRRGIRVRPDGKAIAYTAGSTKSEVWVLENAVAIPNAAR